LLKRRALLPATLLLCLVFPAAAMAATKAPAINSGDTAFVLISAALVMAMTAPGLAFFYGGMVRKKNVMSTIMFSFITLCLVSVQWVLWGYSLAFGPDKAHLVGSLAWLGLNHVGFAPDPNYSSVIPAQVYMVFQLMFAAITPALISGSLVERIRFPAFLVFILVWTTVIYDPLAHWVWGAGGWLHNLGVLDFAGGTVVHISSGVSGLVAALVLGKRIGHGKEPMIPHNLPFTVLGASMLWFGWFGFNAGSALAANGLAASAFIATNTAAAASALSWMIIEWWHHGKPTALGAASGAVAGLVAITPASGFVTPVSAILIGLGAGVVCYLAISLLKHRLGYDDALDAFGCHAIGGTFGAIATGFFATVAVNPAGANGLFYGNPAQVGYQLIGVASSWVLAAGGTFVILKVIGLFMPLRATRKEELEGLDISQMGEQGYTDYVLAGSIGLHREAHQAASAMVQQEV
jgi:Amt family ammonium transporter